MVVIRSIFGNSMPLELNTLLYCNGRSLLGFHLRVKNEPGVLERIIKVISGKGLNIVSVVSSMSSPEAEETLLFIGVDFTNKEHLSRIVAKEVSTLDVVYEVKPVKPTMASILYDEKLFPIHLGGKPAIILGRASMVGFTYGLKRRFGEAVAGATLYHAGYTVGQVAYELYIAKSRVKDDSKLVATEILRPLMVAYGWCIINVRKVFAKGPLLEAQNLWECEVQKEFYIKKGIRKATSHYVRGFLAGIYDKVFKGRTRVREIKCVNLGDKSCLFEIVKLHGE